LVDVPVSLNPKTFEVMGLKRPKKRLCNMTIELRCTSGRNVLPPGPYNTTCMKVETKDVTYDGRTTKRLMIKFVVASGKHQGDEVYAFTGTVLGPKTKLFKFLTSMMGRQIQPGELVNIDSFVGKDFFVIVDKNPQSDSTQVVSICPATATI
jgi:hypothetical protein